MASLREVEKRLSFFDNVSGEFTSIASACIFHSVGLALRDEQHLTGVESNWRTALEYILQRTFEDVHQLFTGMSVARGRRARCEIDQHLDYLLPGDAQVV